MLVAGLAAALVAGIWPVSAHATLAPAKAPVYVPAGFVGTMKTEAQVDGYLANFADYGFGQLLFELPGLRHNGTMRLTATHIAMMDRWIQRAALYQAQHGVAFEITAVINGRVSKMASLDKASIRANIVAAVKVLVADNHMQGVNLDFEPYPNTASFLRLLDELNTMYASVGFTGRVSIVTPTFVEQWSPSYWASVASRVNQLNPTFYDSTFTSVAEYKLWIEDGLAQISAAVPPSTLIVPILASYRQNPWHNPLVENMSSGAAALQESLAAGSRVHGAGAWWWWGLFYNEGGRYNAAADRAAWQGQVRILDYTAP